MQDIIRADSYNRVFVSHIGVRLFNAQWPCSKLRDTRSYWFQFDERNEDLIDTDMPESDDGPEASALADDCKAFLFDSITPDWAA